MDPRLPVFPLGTVLFPGLVLPLHIFEERYRQLVRHLVALPDGKPREFGVVAIRRGWEVLPVTAPAEDPDEADQDGTGPRDTPGSAAAGVTLHEVGCTAELRQVTELPDGRYDLITVGRRRFRITEVDDTSTPYLTAAVDWLAEEPGQEELARLLAPRVLAAFHEYLRVLRPDSDEVIDQVPDDPTVLSHLVAATVSLTVEDRQRLLAAPDTATRLRAELRLLSREGGLLRRVRAVPVPLSELAGPVNPN